MVREALHDAAELQVPDDDLSILTSACNESIALADVDVGDEIKVAVKACLEAQSVAVPDFDNATSGRQERVRGQCLCGFGSQKEVCFRFEFRPT